MAKKLVRRYRCSLGHQTLNSYIPFEVLLFVFLGSLILITDILFD
jgi:hypothetical protein